MENCFINRFNELVKNENGLFILSYYLDNCYKGIFLCEKYFMLLLSIVVGSLVLIKAITMK